MKAVAWMTGWLLALAGVVSAAPPATRPASPAVNSKASVEMLVQQGLEAMAAKQTEAARDAFSDAVVLDRSNRVALHGLAVCQMSLKEMGRAKDCFEKSLALSPKPDRALVLNAAAFYQTTKTNMRAIKLIKDYMVAHPNDLDEPMLNALGTLLNSANATERNSVLFRDAAAFYMGVNARMEAARPGNKRFGDQWVPEADYFAKFAQWQAKEKEIGVAADAVAAAEDKLADAEDLVALYRSKLRWSKNAKNQLPTAEAAVRQAEKELAVHVKALEKVMAQVSRPTFPKKIPVAPLDAVSPPALSIALVEPKTPTTVESAAKPTTVAVATTTSASKPVVVEPPVVASQNPPATPSKPPAAVAAEPVRRARVTHYAAGFAIAPDVVLTAASAVPEGATIQIQCSDGQTLEATLARADRELGLALLKLKARRLPSLAIADAFVPGPVTCPAYPTVDLFNPVPRLLRGLAPQVSKDAMWTVSLGQHPRLPGSPLLNGQKIVGVCIAPRDAELTKLPAVTLEQLRTFAGNDATAQSPASDPANAMVQVVTTREGAE